MAPIAVFNLRCLLGSTGLPVLSGLHQNLPDLPVRPRVLAPRDRRADDDPARVRKEIRAPENRYRHRYRPRGRLEGRVGGDGRLRVRGRRDGSADEHQSEENSGTDLPVKATANSCLDDTFF